MAASGVVVNDDCVTSYNDLKLKHDKAYVIYKIAADGKSVEIESTGAKGTSFDEFVKTILDIKDEKGKAEPRYCVIDFAYETDDGRPQDKLCFVFWSPDTAAIKKKMLYASTKDAIKKKLTGIHAEIQANDASDLEAKEFEASCKR